MRRYFLIARETGVLTRIFCAKLEAEHAKKPAGLSRFLPIAFKPSRRKLEAGFREEGGRLTLQSPDLFERDPVNLLRLFRVADRHNLDLHPDAFYAVHRSLDLITPRLRRDRHAVQAFLDVLTRGQETYRTLSLMSDAGVLGRFVPEFGHVVGQMQFNMYHSYTVDEHTLRAVGLIADIAAGRLKEDHPLSVSVLPRIADREALFLAMLLHDTGKGGEGGQSVAGARTARAACERMRLSPERVDLVAWLVEHHLVMSDFAQKRDVADPRTISAFARIVQNPERLRLLLILTVADIRAVGPGVWNGWKGQLLRELYGATEAAFRGGRGFDPGAHFRNDQKAIAGSARDRLASEGLGGDAQLQAWAQQMEDAYFAAFSTEEQAAHYALARRAAEQGGAAAAARVRENFHAAEVVVAAQDRRGLFADLARTLSGLGGNIVGARVYTSAAGLALDVFQVQDPMGQPFGCDNPRLLERLAAALEQAGRGEPLGFEPRRDQALGRAAAFSVKPTVAFDNEASESATVIEASGRDRPGLLTALAHTLAEAGLSLQSAHVDSYGERAVDAFYVVDADGSKLADARRQAALRAGLVEVLKDAEPETVRSRPKMQRAAASVAR